VGSGERRVERVKKDFLVGKCVGGKVLTRKEKRKVGKNWRRK
jgi:hypothetical protein